MVNMTNIAQRLIQAREWKGWTQNQLASAADLSQSTIGNIESGTRQGRGSLPKIAKALGISHDWLADGEGEMVIQAVASAPGPLGAPAVTGAVSNAETAPALRAVRRVPVVGEVKGGDDGYLEELQYPVGHGDGHVEYWCRDDAAYAVRVRGDSMHPRYRAGEFVVVTPGIEAQPGADVVVALKDGRKLLKQLNWQRDGELQLLSINNHFGPLTLPQTDVLYIHRVAGSVGRDAFVRE